MMKTIDYSKKENWCKLPQVAKDVDTFYVYATEYIMGSMPEGTPDYADMDNVEMVEGAKGEYNLHASAYAEATNVFMPYYRQVGLRYAGFVWKRDGIFDAALVGMPYDDIVNALDYYFEHYNGGRPFIITWNTEGPGNREVNADTCVLQPGSMSINPLNWKLDNTYAPASENLGSLWPNEKGELVIQDRGADAQVFPDRGVVVTHAKGEEMDEETAEVASFFFGPDGRHGEDYALFYNNIKANVAKRVAAYMAKNK